MLTIDEKMMLDVTRDVSHFIVIVLLLTCNNFMNYSLQADLKQVRFVLQYTSDVYKQTHWAHSLPDSTIG